VVGRKRADRKRRDEFPRGRCHDAANRSAAFAQAADQVERLVSGDAAADDEQDALAGEGHLANRRAHTGFRAGWPIHRRVSLQFGGAAHNFFAANS
jgi:hypothetical protein